MNILKRIGAVVSAMALFATVISSSQAATVRSALAAVSVVLSPIM